MYERLKFQCLLQDRQEETAEVVEHENQRQVSEIIDRNYVNAEGRADDGGGALIDLQVNHQDGVQVQGCSTYASGSSAGSQE